ncbi:MAG: hypothetical protein JO149_03780 [Gammaproteobacteria bacterium]|nr:hypothetical protein [Gammaproteobacteria bacterium]
MEIIITQWALDSYLDLKAENVFTHEEYKKVLRIDVLRLQVYPNDSKFKQGKFWSPAQDRNSSLIANGYKMKWHQIGNGRVQLRLTVGIFGNECILCEAYVKKDDKVDNRKLARFKVYLDLIRQGSYTVRGRLT